MSFLTCFWLFPQKEHLSRSPVSPTRGTGDSSPRWHRFGGRLGLQRRPGVRRYPQTLRKSAVNTQRRFRARRRSATRPDAGSVVDHLAGRDDLVDDPVRLGLLGGEDRVPLDVGTDLLLRLTGVTRQDRLQQAAHAQDLVGLDLQVRDLPLALTGGLVDQYARVLQRESLALGARRQQDGR